MIGQTKIRHALIDRPDALGPDGSKTDTTETSYRKLAFKDIIRKNDETSRWYAAGTLEGSVGDWNGKVTYTAVDKAPTYSFSNGTLTAQGTLMLPEERKSQSGTLVSMPTRPTQATMRPLDKRQRS